VCGWCVQEFELLWKKRDGHGMASDEHTGAHNGAGAQRCVLPSTSSRRILCSPTVRCVLPSVHPSVYVSAYVSICGFFYSSARVSPSVLPVPVFLSVSCICVCVTLGFVVWVDPQACALVVGWVESRIALAGHLSIHPSLCLSPLPSPLSACLSTHLSTCLLSIYCLCLSCLSFFIVFSSLGSKDLSVHHTNRRRVGVGGRGHLERPAHAAILSARRGNALGAECRRRQPVGVTTRLAAVSWAHSSQARVCLDQRKQDEAISRIAAEQAGAPRAQSFAGAAPPASGTLFADSGFRVSGLGLRARNALFPACAACNPLPLQGPCSAPRLPTRMNPKP